MATTPDNTSLQLKSSDPEKKYSTTTNPLTHYGRHFCRTVHAMCNIQALLTAAIIRVAQFETRPLEEYSFEHRQEHAIYEQMISSNKGLEDEVDRVAELIRKGSSGARGDDTKALKGAVVEWLVPAGQVLSPPIARNIKLTRGFHHERTGQLLCPMEYDWDDEKIKADLRSGELAVSGMQWPNFLYAEGTTRDDDAWLGLFRGELLVTAYRFIFTSPSSIDKDPKATRSGNARIHNMSVVTIPSIAYVATQLRFALCSASVFSRTDTVTDTERFYHVCLTILSDVEERKEVNELVEWWNRYGHYRFELAPNTDEFYVDQPHLSNGCSNRFTRYS
ncbi:hypothetical protein FIBSPDRAFT_898713 [Athelia psychrophila]|uniref:Fungal-type protein kinase domain-containing protein n=1 Tax=Athelia psychrophila TaxID=1759441 RepID=A0A166APC8_9AGAM|nr:hypothetical protein FIBSPDRAFT_898713 [Fibularhizoctonia sp. CBS 109695]